MHCWSISFCDTYLKTGEYANDPRKLTKETISLFDGERPCQKSRVHGHQRSEQSEKKKRFQDCENSTRWWWKYCTTCYWSIARGFVHQKCTDPLGKLASLTSSLSATIPIKSSREGTNTISVVRMRERGAMTPSGKSRLTGQTCRSTEGTITSNLRLSPCWGLSGSSHWDTLHIHVIGKDLCHRNLEADLDQLLELQLLPKAISDRSLQEVGVLGVLWVYLKNCCCEIICRKRKSFPAKFSRQT